MSQAGVIAIAHKPKLRDISCPTSQGRNPDNLFMTIRKVAHQEKPDQLASYQLSSHPSKFDLLEHVVE
ncbi:hypothetical protein Pdw03_5975 [Penicillium digitatum]|uniref:Uncharacterized protein n=1 Tax=Penicillium digitatum TaxID=36651 RepID=A0A7T6XW30_PENDI|nr:hypothetical protein Pdw03_5975 [Penicillium digitatum]